MIQHWFSAEQVTSHYLSQWWSVLAMQICVSLSHWVKTGLLLFIPVVFSSGGASLLEALMVTYVSVGGKLVNNGSARAVFPTHEDTLFKCNVSKSILSSQNSNEILKCYFTYYGKFWWSQEIAEKVFSCYTISWLIVIEYCVHEYFANVASILHFKYHPFSCPQ